MHLRKVVALGCGLVLGGWTSAVAQTDPAGPSESEMMMTTGTVQSIDKDKRLLVLEDEAGDRIQIQVPPDAPGFTSLRKGQRVDVSYHDSVAVALLPPGTSQPVIERRVRVEPAQSGGIVGREVTVAAQVVNVDLKAKAMDLKLPNGHTHKVTVTDPDLQQQLKELKPGQLARVTFTEAVAATIAPAAPRPMR